MCRILKALIPSRNRFVTKRERTGRPALRGFGSSIGSLAIVALLLSGCVTPLSTSEHGNTVSEAIGKKDSEIRFVSYGNFAAIPADSKDRILLRDGVVTLTDENLYLLLGKLGRLSVGNGVSIPITEIDAIGISVRESTQDQQLQIKYGGFLVLVDIRDNKIRHDREGMQTLYAYLMEDGIPTWERSTFFVNGMRPHKEGFTAGDIVQDVAKEAALQAIMIPVTEGLFNLLLHGLIWL